MKTLYAPIKDLLKELEEKKILPKEDIDAIMEDNLNKQSMGRHIHKWVRNDYYESYCPCGITVRDEDVYKFIRSNEILNTKWRESFYKPFNVNSITDEILNYLSKINESNNA